MTRYQPRLAGELRVIAEKLDRDEGLEDEATEGIELTRVMREGSLAEQAAGLVEVYED